MTTQLENLNVELYDLYVGDWPDELEFYQAYAAQAHARGATILEVACGTGRIAIRLAQTGVPLIGLDHAPAMLDIARANSADLPHVRWIEADMRDFTLDTTVRLAIIPGHAFQNIHTPDDQAATLACIRRHLAPDGTLIVHLDHQNVAWLGEIGNHPFERVRYGSKITHPQTGATCRMAYSWAYERATQTAIYKNAWEELDEHDQPVARHDNDPIRLHCVFYNEMAHLAARTGFAVVAVYGDFARGPLTDASEEMIWVLRPKQAADD